VGDIASHIINSEHKLPRQKGEVVWGNTSLEYHPYGVSLILSGSSDPLGDAVAPLASSVAAGNVVILGSIGSSQTSLFSILQRELSNYLDAFSIHIISNIDFERVRVGDVHQIMIFGMLPSCTNSSTQLLILVNLQMIAPRSTALF
jgi:hypothetical protein